MVRPGEAVKPLPQPPTVRNDWSGYRLPQSGLILVVDLALCARCAAKRSDRPCAAACALTHRLPVAAARHEPAFGEVPVAGADVFPAPCPQCSDPPCARVCPVDAIGVSPEGVVLVDQTVCIGCRLCLGVCPVGALRLIDRYAVVPPPFPLVDYTPEQPSGLFPDTVAKCTLCSYRIERGDLPVCVESCPEGALWVGNLDRNTAASARGVMALDRLLAGRKVVLAAGEPGVVTRLVYLAGGNGARSTRAVAAAAALPH